MLGKKMLAAQSCDSADRPEIKGETCHHRTCQSSCHALCQMKAKQ